MLRRSRAHPDFATLAKKMLLFSGNRRKSRGSASLKVNSQMFAPQQSSRRIREEIAVEVPCSRFLIKSAYWDWYSFSKIISPAIYRKIKVFVCHEDFAFFLVCLHFKGIISRIFPRTSLEKSWEVRGFCTNSGSSGDLRYSYSDWKFSAFQNKTETFWPLAKEG